jgi:hypothetical protein
VLALERSAWCEGGAAAAARKLGGAMVGCRKGASENGSLEVWIWRVGGMVWEVDWSEDGCVKGVDSCARLLLAVLPHVRALSACREVHACRQHHGILKALEQQTPVRVHTAQSCLLYRRW